ncbi:phospholipid carrier-dependent glycosyltransferase [Clostridium sp. J1101437_171009_A5]|uniref:phospholipid carrier-dependent glycosyltransferase n=1 Tax=Clostridium sp. J1101437_171009_A5 TaxID=2787098 RepID=UPI0018995262|nr:phospholipid carrier-dependent glycosyltransferase [Clostridium sp. J1101437_171009_A5]
MDILLQAIRPTLIFPILLLAALFLLFGSYWRWILSPHNLHDRIRRQTGEVLPSPAKPRFSFAGRCHPLERRDGLLILLLTLVYAATAFFQLGSFTNPQSFHNFTETQTVEVEFSQPFQLTRLMYYPGLGTGDYNVEISADGSHWSTLWARENEEGTVTGYYWADAEGYEPSYAMPQHYADLFKWLEITPENTLEVRFLRITAKSTKSPIELGELALYDTSGNLVCPDQPGEASALFDEGDTVPESPSWYNSTYFDEIYHARTAYEHIRGIYPYEISHPPLGKLILGIGIRLFGMTPFGWRFMGTLFGVLMLPLLYAFLKNLFGKTPVAFCGTALFAFDFMHLTQTRIATIDTYGVFFILAMYYFMYRYLTLPAGTPFRKGAPWLFLSGLFWGIGAASKWTVIYGGVGLALLYFLGLWFKLRDWPKVEAGETPPVFRNLWLIQTLAFSVLCFVVIPACIYTLSYWPYAAAKGDTSLGNLIHEMWKNQEYMLTYHQGVHDTHPYSSRWYQWIVDGRPILYYLDYTSVPGSKSAFAAFSNPVVCWGGLLAVVSLIVHCIRRSCGKALFIVVAYFSHLAPWFFIGRTTFEYHYFPSILFLCFALAYVYNDLFEMGLPWMRKSVYALTGTAVALYAAFYPVLIGLMVPRWYTSNLLQWLPSWPI